MPDGIPHQPVLVQATAPEPGRATALRTRRDRLRIARDFRYHPVMGIFGFILIIMILSGIFAPIAKGLGERLSKGAPDNRDLARLREELERAEQRLAETERRLQLAEERMDFQEQLLSSRSSARIPPGDR